MTRAHLLATALVLTLASALACYPDAEPQASYPFQDVLCDAGLCGNLARLDGLSVRVAAGSDGGSFPPPPQAKGFKWLYDYGGEACASYPGERVLWVAALDSPYVCHGFAHVLRTDDYVPGLGCADRNGDHAFFDSVQLDAKCREATR